VNTEAAMSDFEHVFEKPPEGAAEDWTIPQDWARYTEVEHQTWDTLYARQMKILPGRAAEVFFDGLKALDLNTGGIPDFEVMNPKLQALTGWTVVCVPGLVPDDVFFDHLANRRFPSGQFIRRPDQLDYLQEPDIFHDVFGHVPMLTNPDFADYMEAYGRGGQRAAALGMLPNLARLYWYTVEFGLMREDDQLRIYGAGIVSSATESVFCLEDPSPNRLGFDLERVMKTLYRIDDFQQVYFVIDTIDQLKRETLKDFGPIYARLMGAEANAIEAILPTDVVFSQGTQAYAEKGGRFAA
jgi:phenylalanine-4-hydroxylase